MPKNARPFGKDRPSIEELQQLQKEESSSKIPPASLGVTLDDILKKKGQPQPAGEGSPSMPALPLRPDADELVAQGAASEAPLSRIVVNPEIQPRLARTDDQQERLTTSIAVAGKITRPVLVRLLDNGNLELLGGYGRYRSAFDLGWSTIPIRLIEADDAEAEILAVADNEGHTDLTDFEKGRQYAKILSRGKIKNQRALASRLGASLASVTRCLSFMKLPPQAIQYLEAHPDLVGGRSIADFVTAGESHPELVLQALHKIEEEGISQEAALRWIEKTAKDDSPKQQAPSFSTSQLTLGNGRAASMTVRKNTISLKLPKDLDMSTAQEAIRKALESIQ
jgi:ParB family chromosome partitioning protein